jgi:hypothetical protein
MCCKVLVIDELKKDAGPLCKDWCKGVGCSIYEKRPQVCRDFECEWLTEREVPLRLKPDAYGTIFIYDGDCDQYQAVCDPKEPARWRHPQVFQYLVSRAKAGQTVVAKSGAITWRIYASGETALTS